MRAHLRSPQSAEALEVAQQDRHPAGCSPLCLSTHWRGLNCNVLRTKGKCVWDSLHAAVPGMNPDFFLYCFHGKCQQRSRKPVLQWKLPSLKKEQRPKEAAENHMMWWRLRWYLLQTRPSLHMWLYACGGRDVVLVWWADRCVHQFPAGRMTQSPGNATSAACHFQTIKV